jgi:BNR repeat-like domain
MKRISLAAACALAAAFTMGPAASAEVDPLSLASGPSPFSAECAGPQEGTLYLNAEVEPWVAVNPDRPRNLIGVWQQDRWSNGGANGNLTGVSFNGGASWFRPDPPPFSRCAGGNATNGGDYERATDPWVSFSPNGDAHQIALGIGDLDSDPSAILVSSSRDGGVTWGPIKTLIRDEDGLRFFNDKQSITADPTDSDFVYAVWDRLASENLADPAADYTGPTYFARSTDGGRSWEPARNIYDPGVNDQTIGNQIVVLPNGRLVNVFTLFKNGQISVAAIFSDDRGETWSSEPVIIDFLGTVFVSDPRDGAPVRTGDILPEVAVDPRAGRDDLYVVWQDARFTAFDRDQVALSKSSDGGLTWSRPARVSSNIATQAFTPSVDVNRNGRVAVTYYDFTNDTPASPTLDTDYWVTRSGNGGATFSDRERITPEPFDMRSAPFAGGFFVGDYEGLASVGVFRPLFVQANTGDADNPTDVFSTTVRGPLDGLSAASRKASRVRRARAAAKLRGGRRAPGRLVNGVGTPYATR